MANGTVTMPAQNQVIPVDTGRLIENKPEERLLIKFKQLKEKDLATKKVAESFAKRKKVERVEKEVKIYFAESYIDLASNLHGLSADILNNLTRDERAVLNDLMLKVAKHKAKWFFLLRFLVPPTLGLILLVNYNYGIDESYNYYHDLQKMKKLMGDQYFPHEELEELLALRALRNKKRLKGGTNETR